MIHDVVSAEYKEGYKIEVVFKNGLRGIVNLSAFLLRGGVFNRFRDMDFFRDFQANEEFGTLTWGDEVDISPRLYTRKPRASRCLNG